MRDELPFSKFHALGNDYAVLDPARVSIDLTPRLIQALCDRRHGIGADGILFGPLAVPKDPGAFGLRIFNPDGSEAEKSGNGLRIFARYLMEAGYTFGESCRIHTPGGVSAIRHLAPDGSLIQVDMGKASFKAEDIGFTAIPPGQEVIETPLFLDDGRPVIVTALSLGNPHCVLFPGSVSPSEARRLGPRIERHPAFPRRVNVQLVSVIDRKSIRIEIWERGAGYTLASGSSSCAAASACRRLGLVGNQVTVIMPGGRLSVSFSQTGRILMTGPVQAVFQGRLHQGWIP